VNARNFAFVIAIVAGLSAPGFANAETLDAQQKAIELIESAADRICNVVSTKGEAKSSEVKGNVNAQLSGLASKLVDVGVSGAGSINSEDYQSVLRQDLAATLKDNAACKLKVFDTLQSKLFSPAPETPPAGNHNSATGLEHFLGAWVNIDPNTRGVPKLYLSLTGQNVLVHAWGACHPTPCDWGEVKAEPYASTVSSNVRSDTTVLQGVFKPAFAETTFLIRPNGEEGLRFEEITHFTDNSGRANYSSTDIFQRAK